MLKASSKNIVGPAGKTREWRQGQVYRFVWPLVVNALLLSQGPPGLKGQKVSHLSSTILLKISNHMYEKDFN